MQRSARRRQKKDKKAEKKKDERKIPWDEREVLQKAFQEKAEACPDWLERVRSGGEEDLPVTETLLIDYRLQYVATRSTSLPAAAYEQKKQEFLTKFIRDSAFEPASPRTLISKDLSFNRKKGKRMEPHQVPKYCDLDNIDVRKSCNEEEGSEDDEDQEETPFEYIDQNEATRAVWTQRNGKLTYRCECSGPCRPDTCNCLLLNMAVNKTEISMVDGSLNIESPSTDVAQYALVTCGELCGCPPECANRICNMIGKNRFEIFRRDRRIGFGVRTLTAIPFGEIVSEFRGEVMPEDDLSSKSRNWAMLLAGKKTDEDGTVLDDTRMVLGSIMDNMYAIFEKEEMRSMKENWRNEQPKGHYSFFIDPRNKGTFSRFLTHGCWANLQPLRVIANYLAIPRHRLFFYASQAISAGSELYFDYGEEFRKRLDCRCGTPLCKTDKFFENFTRKQLFKLMRMIHRHSRDVARDKTIGMEQEVKNRIASTSPPTALSSVSSGEVQEEQQEEETRQGAKSAVKKKNVRSSPEKKSRLRNTTPTAQMKLLGLEEATAPQKDASGRSTNHPVESNPKKQQKVLPRLPAVPYKLVKHPDGTYEYVRKTKEEIAQAAAKAKTKEATAQRKQATAASDPTVIGEAPQGPMSASATGETKASIPEARASRSAATGPATSRQPSVTAAAPPPEGTQQQRATATTATRHSATEVAAVAQDERPKSATRNQRSVTAAPQPEDKQQQRATAARATRNSATEDATVAQDLDVAPLNKCIGNQGNSGASKAHPSVEARNEPEAIPIDADSDENEGEPREPLHQEEDLRAEPAPITSTSPPTEALSPPVSDQGAQGQQQLKGTRKVPTDSASPPAAKRERLFDEHAEKVKERKKEHTPTTPTQDGRSPSAKDKPHVGHSAIVVAQEETEMDAVSQPPVRVNDYDTGSGLGAVDATARDATYSDDPGPFRGRLHHIPLTGGREQRRRRRREERESRDRGGSRQPEDYRGYETPKGPSEDHFYNNYVPSSPPYYAYYAGEYHECRRDTGRAGDTDRQRGSDGYERRRDERRRDEDSERRDREEYEWEDYRRQEEEFRDQERDGWHDRERRRDYDGSMGREDGRENGGGYGGEEDDDGREHDDYDRYYDEEEYGVVRDDDEEHPAASHQQQQEQEQYQNDFADSNSEEEEGKVLLPGKFYGVGWENDGADRRRPQTNALLYVRPGVSTNISGIRNQDDDVCLSPQPKRMKPSERPKKTSTPTTTTRRPIAVITLDEESEKEEEDVVVVGHHGPLTFGPQLRLSHKPSLNRPSAN